MGLFVERAPVVARRGDEGENRSKDVLYEFFRDARYFSSRAIAIVKIKKRFFDNVTST
jgi:hypothetical protein